ncbi:IclR family transcriptional regulator [Geodermatophilus sp. SYSU D00758]
MPNTRPDAEAPARSAPGPAPASAISVDNALQLLQLVGERQALRVAEAADLLGVARSTAHRLLTALRRRGFVVQDRPNGAYRPGPALYEVGLAVAGRIDVRRIARPVLEQLREQTQETASLAVLEGPTVRFVDGVESTRSVRVGNRVGVVRPAHATAVGKAVLAALPEEELARVYPDGRLPPAATAAAIGDLDTLRAELAAVRARGYAVNWEESADGMCAVGVALSAPLGHPRAALGLAAPISRVRDVAGIEALAPVLLRGAELVHHRLRGGG